MGTLSHNLREQTRTRANPSTYIQGVNMKLTSMLMMLMGVMMMMMTVLDGVAAGKECKDNLGEKKCTPLKKLGSCNFPALAKKCAKTCGFCTPSPQTGNSGCKDKLSKKRCTVMKVLNFCKTTLKTTRSCDLTCGFKDC